jgi:hypothetical protein
MVSLNQLIIQSNSEARAFILEDSVVDPELFFSDPAFQIVSDLNPAPEHI